MDARRIFKYIRELLDVDQTGIADGDALIYDLPTTTWVATSPSAGGNLAGDDAGSLAKFDTGGALGAVSLIVWADRSQGYCVRFTTSVPADVTWVIPDDELAARTVASREWVTDNFSGGGGSGITVVADSFGQKWGMIDDAGTDRYIQLFDSLP